MFYAEKGNRVKRIQEFDIPRYVEQGYKITDGHGTLLKDTVPTDLPNLRLAYNKKEEELKEKDAIIAELTAKVAALETELQEVQKKDNTLLSEAPKPRQRKDKADKITE